ncbi:MAG: AAA family ATPase [Lachnospiraceae bacterium]|nr:AAA family ATPase [Lachnospiraceae bacterium]
MGQYLNPGNTLFTEALRSEIYVDKTELLAYTNRVLETKQKLICVSRPRRFGKSMTTEMMAAYYSRGCDSTSLFERMKVSRTVDFTAHLNRHNVIYMDIQLARSVAGSEGFSGQFLSYLQKQVIEELSQEFGEEMTRKDKSLAGVLQRIHAAAGERFIIIIDEWDCLFREEKHNIALQKEYITFLRSLFKGAQAEVCISLAYLTGILPIKKYGTESALNNFKEFTMVNPGQMAEYMGFTEGEVAGLCARYGMDFAKARQWYDGYRFREETHIYSPRSIVEAMLNREFGNYWTQTETYESLKAYIDLNFDGLKDAIVRMLSGGQCEVDTGSFQNDMTTFKSRDDILTLLTHLGYLAYERDKRSVFIPNEEVREEFVRAVKNGGWDAIAGIINRSRKLLEDTLAQREGQVAAGIAKAHSEAASILTYNDENALSCVITLAYISAREDYTFIRELPSGEGFADIVFFPKRHSAKPAIVVELKWNKSAEGAIAQIKEKRYGTVLEEYGGEILLVGINYNKTKKLHSCKIEKHRKQEIQA